MRELSSESEAQREPDEKEGQLDSQALPHSKIIVYVPYPVFAWIAEKARGPQVIERPSIPSRIVIPVQTQLGIREYHILPKGKK